MQLGFHDFEHQWRSQGGAQGARAPSSAHDGLAVNIVHGTASSSTPLATLNHQLLLKKQLRR